MDTALESLTAAWQALLGVLTLAASVLATGHAVLHKRDARAAIAWVGLIWLVPIVGAILYALLGINRIRRRATALLRDRQAVNVPAAAYRTSTAELRESLGEDGKHLLPLSRLVGSCVRVPLVAGNAIEPLVDGDAAYPVMLEAIDAARGSVALATYIFDHDDVGRRFQAALKRAVERGVEVRVLVDDVGSRYSLPITTPRALRRAGVRVATFLPSLVPTFVPYMNLRNHRKLLVVDGRVGFTGGMNIRAGHVLAGRSKHPIRDLHFRVEGPVVAHLMQTFAEDWSFTTREVLGGQAWFPPLEPRGEVHARGVSDGPDEDFEVLRTILLGALSCAQRSVRVVTPYFLPDGALINALNVASLRGVDVEIVMPARGNLTLVQWAAAGQLWQVLERGCRVYLGPRPFDHTKLLVVDGLWTLLGSGNWDPRSLRLNFEFNLECYDPALGAALSAIIDAKIHDARRIEKSELDRRPLPVRLRDGIARLLTPYL